MVDGHIPVATWKATFGTLEAMTRGPNKAKYDARYQTANEVV